MVDLIDIVLEGAKEAVWWFAGLYLEGLRSGYRSLTAETFGTPTPETDGTFVFGTPTEGLWPELQDSLVGGEIMLTALLLLIISVQGRHVVRIFDVGSGYGARKAKRTAWSGAFVIITWYWIAVTVLYLVDGFAIALIPDLASISGIMVDYASANPTNAAYLLVFALIGGTAMILLEALFYLRTVLLYIYLYGMPIAIAIAASRLPVLSTIAAGFCRRFIPLAVLPLPAAIVFKGYDLVYSTGALTPETAALKLLVAASLPLVALYATWKTFAYASPLTAKTITTSAKGTALLGGVSAGAYLGGASAATTAARWGPQAAAGQAVAQRCAPDTISRKGPTEPSRPTYRRTENDPDANETHVNRSA